MFAESLLFILVIVSIGVHVLNAITGDFPVLHLWWLVPFGVGLDVYIFDDRLLVALALAITLIVTAGLMPQRPLR